MLNRRHGPNSKFKLGQFCSSFLLTDIESFYLNVVANTVGIVHRRLAEKIDVLLLHLLLLLNLAHHLLSFCNFLQSLDHLEN